MWSLSVLYYHAHLKEEVFSSHGIEIVFVSSDRDDQSFAHYFGTMPWLAIPYTAGRYLQKSISMSYGVQGIPSLVILDALSGQIVVTKEQSRRDIMNACRGGDAAIEDLMKNKWLGSLSPETKDIYKTLEMSCQEDEKKEDNDEQDFDDEDDNHPYLVRGAKTSDSSERIKELFALYVKDGMNPNAAAAKAIQFKPWQMNKRKVFSKALLLNNIHHHWQSPNHYQSKTWHWPLETIQKSNSSSIKHSNTSRTLPRNHGIRSFGIFD